MTDQMDTRMPTHDDSDFRYPYQPPDGGHTTDAPGSPLLLSEATIEGRLEALVQTIRDWDWRSMPSRVGEPPNRSMPAEEPAFTAQPTVAVPSSFAPVSSPAVAPEQPPFVTGNTTATDLPPTFVEPGPVFIPDAPASVPAPQTLSTPPTVATVPPVGAPPVAMVGDTWTRTAEPGDITGVVPTVIPGPRHMKVEGPFVEVPSTATAAVEVVPPEVAAAPESPADTDPRGATRPKRRLLRLVLPWLFAAVMVVAIVVSIRVVAIKPSSNDLSPTTITHDRTRTTTPPVVLSPVATQYQQIGTPLQQANTVAVNALAALSADPTVEQVSAITTPYVATVKLFFYNQHLLAIPASMAANFQTEHSQMQAYVNFLQSINTVTSSTVSTWLAQLKSVGSSTEAADNVLRHDFGLPNTDMYP
jgi:hypothetical protein